MEFTFSKETAASIEFGQKLSTSSSASEMNDELADVVLEVEGRELRANRAVLAHYSPVFSRMFFGDFKEKDQTKIHLPGKSYAVFSTFLKVMYPQSPTDRSLITDENLAMILELAEEYQVDNVKARCQDYIGAQLFEHSYRNFIRNAQFQSPARSEDVVDRMMLYICMCDKYNLPRYRERVLSVFMRHMIKLDSLQESPHYNSVPTSSKVSILEALCRKLSGGTVEDEKHKSVLFGSSEAPEKAKKALLD